MPNIEIHGYLTKEWAAQTLKEQIFKELFVDKPYVKEMVVTIVGSKVIDAEDHLQPFLRLLSSNPKEAEEILGILSRKFSDIDIEYIKIKKFIPKKQ